MKKNIKWIIPILLVITILSVTAAIYYYAKYNEINNSEPHELKPLIYLYPKEETFVSVKLLAEDKLIVTYPKYNDSWNVLAKPNGDLIDTKTNRSLYGLYWEGLNTTTKGMEDYGFVVKGTDTVSFLEEKLALLGLNEREANEFIIFWLPKLENSNYNYIRFATDDEINTNMPLEILPKPDTLIRINMEYYKLENMIDIKEQKIVTPSRTGFVVVEWGGTNLDLGNYKK